MPGGSPVRCRVVSRKLTATAVPLDQTPQQQRAGRRRARITKGAPVSAPFSWTRGSWIVERSGSCLPPHPGFDGAAGKDGAVESPVILDAGLRGQEHLRG